jgi:hypothetical protein
MKKKNQKIIYECHILSQEMYKNVVQYKIPVCVEAPNNPVEPNPVVCPRFPVNPATGGPVKDIQIISMVFFYEKTLYTFTCTKMSSNVCHKDKI